MSDNTELNVDAGRLLAIIQQENPQVYELALRRAVIEHQREVIAMLQAVNTSADLPA